MQGQGVDKIVFIPAYMSSYNKQIKEIKYALQLTDKPDGQKPVTKSELLDDYSDSYFGYHSLTPHSQTQIKDIKPITTTAQIVMTGASDGSLIGDTVQEGLKPFASFIKGSCLALFATAGEDDNANKMRYLLLDEPLRKLKSELELASLIVLLYTPYPKSDINKENERRLKQYHKAISPQCKKIAVGYSFYSKYLDKIIERQLFRQFYLNAKTATPSQIQIKKWLENKIEQGKKMHPLKKFTAPKNKMESSL